MTFIGPITLKDYQQHKPLNILKRLWTTLEVRNLHPGFSCLVCRRGCFCPLSKIGPLHDPVKWYETTHAGEQVTQWDFQNKATRTSPPWPAFVLEVPLCNLLTSMCDFVPCDRVVQRAYSYKHALVLFVCFCKELPLPLELVKYALVWFLFVSVRILPL